MTTSLKKQGGYLMKINMSYMLYEYLKEASYDNDKSMVGYVKNLIADDMKKNMVFTLINGEIGQEYIGGAS